MSTFTIDKKIIQQLVEVNQLEIPEDELVFIGIRGAIIGNANDQEFKTKQDLSLMDVNYINPRCTILQWRQDNNKIAAFPGSTVPHQSSIKSALAKGGAGANNLMTGYYKDYRKGVHKAGSPTGHDAFRQNAPHPIQRSADDMDFDKDDRIEYDNPQDNIHCGWFDGLTSNSYASAGCQVVMGFPKCKRPGRDKNTGPWRVFAENAYSISQNAFPYILLTGMEIFNLVSAGKPVTAKLRYGAFGPLVEALQQKLKAQSFYEGIIDGDFGERTLKAVFAFQKKVFGNTGVDGVVGRVTAEELELDLKLPA